MSRRNTNLVGDALLDRSAKVVVVLELGLRDDDDVLLLATTFLTEGDQVQTNAPVWVWMRNGPRSSMLDVAARSNRTSTSAHCASVNA